MESAPGGSMVQDFHLKLQFLKSICLIYFLNPLNTFRFSVFYKVSINIVLLLTKINPMIYITRRERF